MTRKSPTLEGQNFLKKNIYFLLFFVGRNLLELLNPHSTCFCYTGVDLNFLGHVKFPKNAKSPLFGLCVNFDSSRCSKKNTRHQWSAAMRLLGIDLQALVSRMCPICFFDIQHAPQNSDNCVFPLYSRSTITLWHRMIIV